MKNEYGVSIITLGHSDLLQVHERSSGVFTSSDEIACDWTKL